MSRGLWAPATTIERIRAGEKGLEAKEAIEDIAKRLNLTL